jgi:phage shock protein PspC (stress-responsive transcriptional regulator)
MILGVCAWLSKQLNIDATILRIIFVIAVLGYGAGLGIYLILWLVKALSK